MKRFVAPAAAVAVVLSVSGPGSSARVSAPLSVRVSHNQLVNGAGHRVQLRGVNRSSFEYACVQG